MNLKFSRFVPEETDQLITLLNHGVKHKIIQNDTAWGDGVWTKEELYHYMQHSIFYVVRDGSTMVGTVSLQVEDRVNWGDLEDGKAMYFHRLATAEDYHGNGLGSMIIDWCKEQAVKANKTKLRLDCPSNNRRLCKYYEKLGFDLVAVRGASEYKGSTATLYELDPFK